MMADDKYICIWPDDTWCSVKDMDRYGYKSDDYIIFNTDHLVPQETIEDFVHNYNRKAWDNIKNTKILEESSNVIINAQSFKIIQFTKKPLSYYIMANYDGKNIPVYNYLVDIAFFTTSEYAEIVIRERNQDSIIELINLES